MKPFSISIFALSLLLLGSVSAGEELKFFELRTYHTNPGKLDALHARFRDHTCELFTKHGMSNIGYWTPKDKPDTLIYLLGYPTKTRAKQVGPPSGTIPTGSPPTKPPPPTEN